MNNILLYDKPWCKYLYNKLKKDYGEKIYEIDKASRIMAKKVVESTSN